MRKRGDGYIYSPTDLCRFMESRFAAWMERLDLERPGEVAPDERSEEMLILAAQGSAHEAEQLEKLRRVGFEVFDASGGDDRVERTLDAMRRGADVVYQGALRRDPFLGYPDFLVRVAGQSGFGAHHYEVWDAKLAKKPRPYFMIQLCCYAEMLEAAQGVRPRTVGVVLGGGERATFRTDDYFFYYANLKRAFLEFMDRFDAVTPPEPGRPGTNGRWESHAEACLKRTDHLLRVANIRADQVAKLRRAGLDTMTALARTRRARVPGIGDGTYERLRSQAKLQAASSGLERPRFQVVVPAPEAPPRRGLALLPPASKLDVFFDMEGYPFVDGGLEYLFGASHVERGKPVFADWWAHDEREERAAFEAFIDWAYARWREDPTAHIYHYASYEVTALRRLMGRYGTREEEVDRLLRHDVFVDLYTVVRQGLVVGAPSYSIKDIEALYRPAREGGVTTAGGSIVAYQRWLESGQPRDWQSSPTLKEIRDYNRDDCESLRLLADWLRERQAESGIAYAPAAAAPAEEPALSERAQELRDVATAIHAAKADGEDRRVADLLGHLVEFHRREAKPTWWAMFDRQTQDEEQLAEDLDCLAGLERVKKAPQREKQSWIYAYRFDPDQDTKIDEGDSCLIAESLGGPVHVVSLDREKGVAMLKISGRALGRIDGGMPERLSLIPGGPVSAGVIEESIERVAAAWLDRRELPRALEDFLLRRPPRIRGHRGGPLQREGETTLDAAFRLAPLMQETTLSIQGPPGTGKTHTAARVILGLLRDGARIGIASNSHKAILNLMGACVEANGGPLACVKVGGPEDDPFFEANPAARLMASANAVTALGGCRLFGGTAWFYSREDVVSAFDYLFVDEAGQVSVANLVGMAPAARNIILLGDQMQLAQPIQGSHPGESGLSTLDYLLQEHATIPVELGLFLGTTHRLHPRICRFISGAVYEDRLVASEKCARRAVDGPIPAGIVFVPVLHEGNTQGSDEEVQAIERLFEDLRGRGHADDEGRLAGKLGTSGILVVAPYNMQVRKLAGALPAGSRVGSVDKFQGQQAPVVILSMCASEASTSPRGMEFLFDPNRLNVAISRAQCLAYVVGNPALANAPCGSLKQMRLANLFCRVLAESAGA